MRQLLLLRRHQRKKSKNEAFVWTDDEVTKRFDSFENLPSTLLEQLFDLKKLSQQTLVRPSLTQNLQGCAWSILVRRIKDTFLTTGIERIHIKRARSLS